MKKTVLLLTAFVAALILFSSCEKKQKLIYTDPEEYSKAISESQSESEKESSIQASKIEDDKAKTQAELGKTIEGKQIVAKLTYGDHIEYEKIVFKKNGIADYRLTYKYFDTDEYFNMVLGYGDAGDEKLVDKDADLRCIVYKNSGPFDSDYETYYDIYSRKDPEICTIL